TCPCGSPASRYTTRLSNWFDVNILEGKNPGHGISQTTRTLEKAVEESYEDQEKRSDFRRR
ncbi:hypothetical protein ACFL2H_13560, partial [Planctomycetota bacterium]